MAENSHDSHDSNSRTYTLPLRNLPVNVSINAQGALPEELEQILQQMMVERRTLPPVVGQLDGAGPNNNRQLGHHQHSHGQPGDTAVIDMADIGEHHPGGDDDDEHEHQHGGPPTAQPRDWMMLWKMVENSIIFVVILLAKLLYDHRLGILVFAGLFGTYYHANTTLTKQIALRESRRYGRSALLLLWIVIFLVANIGCVYFLFQDQGLYKSLFFMLPNFPRLDLWLLLWVVGISDFVVRYTTIIIKTVVAVVPKTMLKFRKRGKFYLLIEETSQMYRNLLPILPWSYFLTDTTNGGPWFSAVLMIIYTVCKANVLYKKAQELFTAIHKFRVESSFGTYPSNEAMKTASESCPICQDQYHDPIMLSCKHIFCEDCVSMWFDREKTCPMCRAVIVDSPVWRDGSTSPYVQLF